MRILFLSPQPFFRERGTPLRARNILRALGEAGHATDLLCYPFGDDLSVPGVRIARSAGVPGIRDVGIGPSRAKILLDIPYAFRAIRLCLRRGYDAIQAVEEAGLFAWAPARMRRRPLVYQMDSWISEQLIFSGFATRGPALALAKWLERAAMRTAALIITVGPDHAADARRLAPGARILVLPDAAPSDRFEPDETGAARLRETLGIGSARCVVYTGNFEPYQGVDLLVQAAGRLAPLRPDVRIVLAGGQPSQIAAMRTLAAAHGASAVCVFAGSRPPDEMPAFLTMADALVSPRCRGRNPPMKIYSYMQTGRPLIATRVRTHTQVLTDATAFLADTDPAALAAAIDAALSDPARARRVADAARSEYERDYSLRRFRERLTGAIADLRRDPPTARP